MALTLEELQDKLDELVIAGYQIVRFEFTQEEHDWYQSLLFEPPDGEKVTMQTLFGIPVKVID